MATVNVFEEKNKTEVSFWKTSSSFVGNRLFFLLLLGLDAVWLTFLIGKIAIYSLLQLCFLGSSSALQVRLLKNCLSAKRCLVCGLCLFVSFFSPSFGVMIGCAYFMMSDKEGIEESVPNALKEQFMELLSVKEEKNKNLET